MQTPVTAPISAPNARRAPRAARPLALSLLAALATLALPAAAQVGSGSGSSPFYFGGSLALGQDTNVLRTASASAQSDTYSIVSVLAGLDQTISRQRVYGDIALRSTRYNDLSQLNGEGYGLNAGVDWSTVGRLSGTLRASANQTQARFTDPGLPTISTRNDERTQQFLALGRWGVAQLFELEASYTANRLEYSNVLARTQNLDQQSIGAAVRYSPSALLTLGVGARGTDGRYPQFYSSIPGSGSPLDFTRRDADLTATWVPSGASRLEARLSATQVDYEQDPARDVSGATGSLTWNFTPTGRTSFTSTVFRDTGAAATFQQIGAGGSSALADNSQLSTGLRVGATYGLTGKITATGNLGWFQRDYEGSLGGTETVQNFGVGLRWEITRAASVGCTIGRENRDSTTPLAVAYGATTTLCTAQVLLR